MKKDEMIEYLQDPGNQKKYQQTGIIADEKRLKADMERAELHYQRLLHDSAEGMGVHVRIMRRM